MNVNGFSSSLPPYFFYTYEETLQGAIKRLDPRPTSNAPLAIHYAGHVRVTGYQENALHSLRARINAMELELADGGK